MSKGKNEQKICDTINIINEIINAINDKQKEFNPEMRNYDKGLLMGKLEAFEAVHTLLKYDSFFHINKLSI